MHSNSNIANRQSPTLLFPANIYHQPKHFIQPGTPLDTLTFADSLYTGDILIENTPQNSQYQYVILKIKRNSVLAFPTDWKLELKIQNGLANEDADDFVGSFNTITAYTRTPNPVNSSNWKNASVGRQMIKDAPSVEITADSFVVNDEGDASEAIVQVGYFVGNATQDPAEDVGMSVRITLLRANIETTVDLYEIEAYYQEVNKASLMTAKQFLNM
jgi:hypothetical protein